MADTMHHTEYHSCVTCGDQIERPTGTSIWWHSDPPPADQGHTAIPEPDEEQEPDDLECDDCGAPAHRGLCARDAWKEEQGR